MTLRSHDHGGHKISSRPWHFLLNVIPFSRWRCYHTSLSYKPITSHHMWGEEEECKPLILVTRALEQVLYWVTAYLILFCQLDTSWKLSAPLLLPAFLAFITPSNHRPLSSSILTLLPPFLICTFNGYHQLSTSSFHFYTDNIQNPLLLLAFLDLLIQWLQQPPPPTYCSHF